MHFLHVRNEDKLSLLLYLLRFVITPRERTVVFVPTKHHVELVQAVCS